MIEGPHQLRVLMLCHHPMGRGADFLRAGYLGRALAKLGHRVTLVCAAAIRPEEARPWLEGGVQAIPVGHLGAGKLARCESIVLAPTQRLSALMNRKFHFVHTFGPRPAVQLPAWVIGRKQGIPIVADWSDWWGFGGMANQRKLAGKLSIGILDHLLERASLNRAAGVTVVTEWAHERVVQQGHAADKVLNLKVGASVDVIKPGDKETARSRLGLGSAGTVLGYSGLSAFDQPLLNELLGRLAHSVPSLRFLLLGRSFDRWRSTEQAGAFLPKSVVIDHVPHHRLGEYLSAVDLMLLPLPAAELHRARMPLRLGDYMAAGLPVVTSDIGEPAALVKEWGIGFVAPAEAGAMAAVVQMALEDRAEMEAMGRRARRLAEEKFSWLEQARALEKLYYSLMDD